MTFRRLMAGVLLVASFVCVSIVSAQPKPSTRPVRIALPSQTIGATHYYVGKSLGVYERHGIELQILVLEPRAALAALLTGDLDFYTATGTSTRAALRNVPIRVALVGLNGPIMCWWRQKRLPLSINCAAKSSPDIPATRR